MSKITIKGRNFELSDSVKNYVYSKFARFEKYDKHILKINVELFKERNPSISDNKIIEVNIQVKQAIIRAEASSPDIYASIDLVIDKLERQLVKYEEKKFRNKKVKFITTDNNESEIYYEEEFEFSTL